MISALDEDSCKIQILEDVPSAKAYAEPVEITAAHLEWVEQCIVSFSRLAREPKFDLAAQLLTTHHHHSNPRMAIAALWAAIEGLFGISTELRFRLSAYVASFLEEDGPARLARFRSLSKQYDYRSKAVHGSPLEQSDMERHVQDVRVILSRLLCKMIVQKKIPDVTDLDSILFR